MRAKWIIVIAALLAIALTAQEAETAISGLYQTEDWKNEKHVPVISAPERVEAGEEFTIEVTVGEEIEHPNTTEHHIRWIEVFFMPDGADYPFSLGRFEFTSHGESIDGPNSSGVYSEPDVTLKAKIEGPGTLIANSYCNIHGLWTFDKRIEIR